MGKSKFQKCQNCPQFDNNIINYSEIDINTEILTELTSNGKLGFGRFTYNNSKEVP